MSTKKGSLDISHEKFETIEARHLSSPWQPDPINPRCKAMLGAQCSFGPEIFEQVMLNMIENPNVTSSYLFRADIFYDSINDVHFDPSKEDLSTYISHMKKEYRPLTFQLDGFDLKRTVVRNLVPRNPQRDQPLVQTCHILQQSTSQPSNNTIETIVAYLPHAFSAEGIPFYHPPVETLLFQHSWRDEGSGNDCCSLALSMSKFASCPTEDAFNVRTDRTALKLLHTIWKHGQGQLSGYVKRVHHDVLVPQSRVQDTYTALKRKYAKGLLAGWTEKTNPTKHVFEDLSIAAFLLELWKDMYRDVRFSGFVDIGCGNGVLVNILRMEGYAGWGFDARKRKSWKIYSEDIQESLKEMVLIPRIIDSNPVSIGSNGDGQDHNSKIEHPSTASNNVREGPYMHDGTFPKGTFIISNHADELTTWTPLLAYLSDCPFVCIPCCSHDLSGARFRAPAVQAAPSASPDRSNDDALSPPIKSTSGSLVDTSQPKTGSLAPKKNKTKQASTYASLCAYVSRLTEEVGFVAEKEMLRIPSTRNEAIVGRRQRGDPSDAPKTVEKEEVVRKIVERELGRDALAIGVQWRERAFGLAKKTESAGH